MLKKISNCWKYLICQLLPEQNRSDEEICNKNRCNTERCNIERCNAENMQLTEVRSVPTYAGCHFCFSKSPKQQVMAIFFIFTQPNAKVSQQKLYLFASSSMQLKQCTQLTQEANTHNNLKTNAAEFPRMIMYVYRQ